MPNEKSTKKNKKNIDTLYERDNEEWLKLCKWLELNIFGYSNDMTLKSQACIILEGLRKGQNIANNNTGTSGRYPSEVILITFQLHKDEILRAISGKDFKSERSKMSYICKIASGYINDVYLKYINMKKTQEKTEQVDHSSLHYDGAEYQTTQDDNKKQNKRFDKLW